jgi:hypothetical protein
MEPEPLILSSAEKLLALRKLDIFHRWESIDERRYCRHCGETITGRQIKVFGGARTDHPSRLECPTAGCLSVPLEWIILDPPAEPTRARPARAQPVEPLAPVVAAMRSATPGWNWPLQRFSIFGFLRPHAFF